MKASDIYGSRYLSADDMPNDGITAEIECVEIEKFKNDRESLRDKLVLQLKNVKKRFALNKTNAEILIEKIGEDFDEWIGHSITLTKVKVRYQGKLVSGISIVEVALPS